ncbi:lytic murein transglycosylase [Candidatus Uhrbacteria bacterium]|nr:lytic murein transglycosylase [Candidatus Uhrbacteria bacterium]
MPIINALGGGLVIMVACCFFSMSGNNREIKIVRRPFIPQNPTEKKVIIQKILEPLPVPVRPIANRHENKEISGPADERYGPRMIKAIAAEFRVPAGALYGIWKKESNWLSGGWKPHWIPAHTLTDPQGTCRSHFRQNGEKKCRRHWQALQAICSQKRDGQPVCDPYRVRVSRAGAMGPTQHMPAVLLRCRNGHCRWADHAVDYDGDGTFDPHRLPEALAATARYLRIRYDGSTCRGDWGCAINLYYGHGQERYFYGHGRKKGVLHWWRDWCGQGNCTGKAL